MCAGCLVVGQCDGSRKGGAAVSKRKWCVLAV